MSAKKDMTGLRFGRLVVLCEDGRTEDRKVKWKCQCDCGNIVSVLGKLLRNGHTQSCGCLRRDKETKHGLTCTHKRLYMSVYKHISFIKEGISTYKDWSLPDRYKGEDGTSLFCLELIRLQPEMCAAYERDKTLDMDKDNSERKVFCPECIVFRHYSENRSNQSTNMRSNCGIRFIDFFRRCGGERTAYGKKTREYERYSQYFSHHKGELHPELVQKSNELIALYTKTLKLLQLLEDARRLRACV